MNGINFEDLENAETFVIKLIQLISSFKYFKNKHSLEKFELNGFTEFSIWQHLLNKKSIEVSKMVFNISHYLENLLNLIKVLKLFVMNQDFLQEEYQDKFEKISQLTISEILEDFE